MSKLARTKDVDFSNSNIKLLLTNHNLRLCNTDLSNYDLSFHEMDGTELISGQRTRRTIIDRKCSLKNTKIKIRYDKDKVTDYDINSILRSGQINDCWLNNSYVNSDGKREEDKKPKEKRILPWSVISRTEQQINNSK